MNPRDPAVDAILTAETLLAQFHRLMPRLTSLLPEDVSDALGEAQRLYPALWASLDRARGLLRDRGLDVPTYDAARARQPAAMLGVNVHTRDPSALAEAASMAAFLVAGVAGVAVGAALDIVGSFGAKRGEVDHGGLHDAHVALAALRGALPDVEWKAIRQHEAKETNAALGALSAARWKKVLLGLGGLAIAVGLAIGLVMVVQSSRPPTVEEKAAADEKEFQTDNDEIRDLNEFLKSSPCDAKSAERRVKLFERHEQMSMARKLAKKFIEQCGENAYMQSVANTKR